MRWTFGVALGATLLVLLARPEVSPLAMTLANQQYLSGDAAAALATWGSVAEGWHWASTRAIAAERAAQTALVLGDKGRALHWYQRAIRLSPSDNVRLRADLAQVYLLHFDDARRAGLMLAQAAQAAPTHDSTGLYVSAARALEQGEDWSGCIAAWSTALPQLQGDERAEAEAALLRAERHLVESSGDDE